MSDESKAVEEVAKTTGKAIDAGRELGGFISKYAGGAIEQLMGIFEDKFKYMRWERQIRLMQRANTFLWLKGLDAPSRYVPLGFTIPVMQAGSLEEDDSLQDRWAALLANAADDSINIDVRRAFVSILEDLTSLDALVLEKIYAIDGASDLDKEIWTTYLPERATVDRPEQESVRPSEDVEVALGNLARLGLVASAMVWGGASLHSCVHKTPLGSEFLRAISIPRQQT